MGTPEDVATEKYFTPPTLTEALRKNLQLEVGLGAEVQAIEDALNAIKFTFKEWLKTVNLPQQMSEESTRQLLITLVDEP